MLYALLVALVAINAGYLIANDRKDKRERSERAQLLQRIQAPLAAVHEHHTATTPAPAPDQPMPMTDEEVAEQDERDRLLQWIEEKENSTPDPGELVVAS